MLRSAKSLRDYHILATDGNIGRIKDFLFDGQEWIVRYVVVDTSEWLAGRKVLLIPSALGLPSTDGNIVPVELTREQVRNSPPFDSDKPVSRQNEVDLFEYYGWSPYWGAGHGGFTRPVARAVEPEQRAMAGVSPAGDPNLRSMREVDGYSIEATNGEIGHVEDFILDDEQWTVRYLVVDTRKWLSGKRVLVSPEWVDTIRWRDRIVRVELSKEQIRDSPSYDPYQAVNRQDEVHLYDYYGRPKYWA
jgi:sporulation protein YlmC with PRC-barrel domain